MRGPETLREIVSRKGLGRSAGRKVRLEMLRLNWKAMAGEKLSGHTRPSSLSRGTLTVSAQGGPWASEAAMCSGRLLKKAQDLLGREVVRKIKVRSVEGCGEVEDEGKEKGGRVEDGPMKREDRALEGVRDIRDHEVREALRRLIESSGP